MKRVLIFTALLASFGFAGVAKADSVSASDGFGGSFTAATSCNGSLLCTITLTIDTTGSSLSDINAVAIKVGTTDVGGTFSISGQSNGDLTSEWTLSSGALNSSTTCSGGGNGQLCAFDPDFTGVNTGGTLVFTWTGVQVDANSIQHVGYQYNSGNSTSTPKGNIVSCSFTNDVSSDCGGTTTKTPEPASMLLLGLGLAGLPFLRRKRS